MSSITLSDNRMAFVLFFILSLVLLLGAHQFSMVGGDEGRFVFDAIQIEKGQWPVADHTTRGPLLLTLIYWSAKVFGFSLLAFRLPGIVLTALTTALLFLLGKELFTRRIGIVAALIYAINPYTLWNDLIIKTETPTIFCVVLAALFFVYALKREQWHWYVLAGVFTGVAYIERHSAVAFMLTLALATSYHVWSGSAMGKFWFFIKGVTRRGFLLMSGVALGFGSIFGVFALRNFSNAVIVWLTPFYVDNVLEYRQTYTDPVDKIWNFLRGWALVFTEGIAIEGWVLYPTLIIFLVAVIYSLRMFSQRTKNFLAFVVIVLLCGGFFYHALNIYRIGYFRPFVFLSLAVFSAVFWGAYYYHRNDWFLERRMYEHEMSVAFLVSWVSGLVIAYSFFDIGYHRELIPPLTLIAAFVLVCVEKRHVYSLLGIALIGLYVVSVAWFFDPQTGGWWWRQDTITQVARYLEDHTTVGEAIFTANTLPVYIAQREVFGDITSYSMRFAKNPNEGWGTFPSPRRVFEQLQQSPPRYVLIDGRMDRHIFAVHPFFKDFVYAQYQLVESFGTGKEVGMDWVEVWERR